MVFTVKFSQFAASTITNPSNKYVGFGGGANFQTAVVNTWTTAMRPSPPYPGLIGYNTNLNDYEFWDGTVWIQVGSGGSGSVTLVNSGTGLTGGPITSTGTLSFASIAADSLWANNSGITAVPTVQAFSSMPWLLLSGGTMTGDLILNGNPTLANQAANKAYVDLIASGIIVQLSCLAATTVNLAGYTYNNGAAGVGATLTAGSNGAFSVDGVSPVINSRILVKNQTTTFQNGIYTLTTVGDGSNPAVLTRATNYDTPAEILPGDLVPIDSGTINGGTAWLQTATVTAVGTDPILFTPFSVITAGTGLTKVGNQISLTVPVTVSLGGTGQTSLTAYAVLCGGTTSTNPIQSIASVGTVGQILTSNGPGALPTFQNSGAVTFTVPQVTVLNAGSGMYTTPANTLYLKVQGVGAGGSGAGASTNNGNLGGNTTFGTAFLIANGGAGGLIGTSSTPPAAIATGGDVNIDGGQGSQGSYNGNGIGGVGGPSILGGGGVAQYGFTGGASVVFGGGGAGGAGDAAHYGGSGGNAGAYFEKIISSPVGSYTYFVGTGGLAVTGTGTGFNSGPGGDGLIIVTAYFQ